MAIVNKAIADKQVTVKAHTRNVSAQKANKAPKENQVGTLAQAIDTIRRNLAEQGR